MKRPLLERDIEKRLVQRAKELGGEVRKVKWIGRSGAPDRLLMLPMRKTPVTVREVLARRYETGECLVEAKLALEMGGAPATIWVELKAPGKKPEPHQLREHARMCKMGQRVEVIDSYEQIEELLK